MIWFLYFRFYGPLEPWFNRSSAGSSQRLDRHHWLPARPPRPAGRRPPRPATASRPGQDRRNRRLTGRAGGGRGARPGQHPQSAVWESAHRFIDPWIPGPRRSQQRSAAASYRRRGVPRLYCARPDCAAFGGCTDSLPLVRRHCRPGVSVRVAAASLLGFGVEIWAVVETARKREPSASQAEGPGPCPPC
jgi:hypothetical protein